MQTNPYQNQIKQLEIKIKDSEQLLADPELGKLAQEEIERLKKQKQSLQKAASDYQQSLEEQEEAEKNPTKKSAAILEIRAGAGGDEAKIWAADLLRMYSRYCANKGLQVKIVDDLVIKISGKTTLSLPVFETETCENQIGSTDKQFYPYQLFQTEAGVHRVQRIPTTETQGRIHTSTASVAVLPEIQAKDVSIRKEDLEWEFMRSSGAGGQSVNKTNSAVRLKHVPTNIAVRVSQERKQLQNRQIALELLRSQLWKRQVEEREKKLGKARAAIGRNERAEKIRTYNYPQNRITDHRVHHSWHQLESILEGNLDEVIGLVSTILNKQ